ncbi:MAG: hypothetical protein CVV49_00120 [Spirochaetae bacterium HGW-Spirochaetae-5]|nr:MAG: hypothetical protein CVV49_00120 [Spirochaetae bacterium HGW-Spirochaetae-5]
MKKFKMFAVVLSLLIFAVGCSSTVKIQSVPGEAKIFIDGELKGVTPYAHTDSKPLWMSTEVKLQKDEYKDFQTNLQKSEFNIIHIFSYLWWMDYPAEKTYTLEKK